MIIAIVLISALLHNGSKTRFQGVVDKDIFDIAGKKSESYVKTEGPRVAQIVAVNKVERETRSANRVETNRRRRHLVAVAPPFRESRGVTTQHQDIDTTLTETSYVADVTVRVIDDSPYSNPLPDFPVSVSEVQVDRATPLMFATKSPTEKLDRVEPTILRTSSAGTVELKDVRLPAGLSVNLPTEKSAEWSIDSGNAEGEELAIVPPKGALGSIVKSSKPRLVSSKRVGNKTYRTFRKDVTQRIQVSASDPVVVRREVADFVMPKMIDIASLRGLTPTFLIGSNEVKPDDSGPVWHFRIKRDMIADENAKLAIDYPTDHGDFFGEVDVPKPDFYKDNQLTPPSVALDALPDKSIVIANKRVDKNFRVSPMQMLTDSGADEITGQDALLALGFTGKLGEVDSPEAAEKKKLDDYRLVPGPKSENGRYGQWLILNDLGITLRCRWDPDDSKAGRTGLGRKYLPAKSTYGLLEAVRVTKPEGGTVAGALRVGATQQEILDAFGAPDKSDIDPYKLLGMQAGDARSRDMFGDKNLETWDDTYLYGGIRIRWDAGHVKWYEIARPVQLLYNGTKAFNPPESKALFVRNVRGSGGYDDEVRRELESFISRSSGVRLTSASEDADLYLDADYKVVGAKREVTHQYPVKKPELDSKGNVVFHRGKEQYVTVLKNEGFTCPEADATADLSAVVSDSRGEQTQHINLPSSFVQLSGPHTAGQRCSEPSLQQAMIEALAGRTTGGKTWIREFANAVATNEDVSGTVLAANYRNGKMLVNLGEHNGIHEKGDEGTEMRLYLLTDVDVKTGRPKGDIADTTLIGGGGRTWLEVEQVGPDWCIVQPKTKDGFGHTKNDLSVIPRIVDPGSGLVRVRVVGKVGTK